MKFTRLSPRKTQSLGTIAKSLLSVVFAAGLCVDSVAQEQSATGIISVSIQDADYGGSVLGAKVTLVENQMSAKTSVDGRYFMTKVPAGTYTVLVTAPYYKSSQVQEVVIAEGEVAKINIPLYNDASDIVELESFKVQAKVLLESDVGLLSQRQKAASISDAMGSETFGRLGLGDAADVLAKVTGASIQDGKYMVVRGLSDRYNANTTSIQRPLPGLILPFKFGSYAGRNVDRSRRLEKRRLSEPNGMARTF